MFACLFGAHGLVLAKCDIEAYNRSSRIVQWFLDVVPMWIVNTILNIHETSFWLFVHVMDWTFVPIAKVHMSQGMVDFFYTVQGFHFTVGFFVVFWFILSLILSTSGKPKLRVV